MKILQVIAGLHRIGGTTTFVVGLSNALSRQGADVSIATYRPFGGVDDVIPEKGVRVVSVAEAEKCLDYDVVHVHGLWDREVFWASGWALRNNMSLYWSPHGMLSPWALSQRRWKKILPWYLYVKRRLSRTAAIHVTSLSEAGWVRDLGFKCPIINVPLGTDLPSFEDVAAERKKVILFVGRIHSVKGLDRLVAAWEVVKDSHMLDFESWRVRIVGADDRGCRADLEQVIKRENMSRYFEFVGPRYGDDLFREYQRAWVSVLPSYSENFGGVVIDSLANYCPVIASTHTPWKVLCEEECGWWVDNNPQILAAALRLSMSMPKHVRDQMGVRGRKLVESTYTWDAVGRKMLKEYERRRK